MTRLLHTGDWHLGRYLHGVSLLDDQRHVLDQLVAIAREERVDAVLVAGDVYDRSVPPADAVALLDDVLARLVVDADIPVVLIAGNHDNPERIGFGARILRPQGLHVRGALDDLSPVLLRDAAQGSTLAIHPLPYAEPIFVRTLPGADEVGDHQAAMAHLVSLARARFAPHQRHLLLGHAFVVGGNESESERPLSVGGAGLVTADTFEGFDFVALGHLHQAQTVGAEHIHYAGSPLKYSFNEVDHDKGVSIIEIGRAGPPTVRRVPLRPRRDMRIVTGTLAELLQQPDPQHRDHYLCAHLTDSGPVLDPMARLREVYPHMVALRFVGQPQGPATSATAADHRTRHPAELFRAFYLDMVGEDLGDDALGLVHEGVQAAQRAHEEQPT